MGLPVFRSTSRHLWFLECPIHLVLHPKSQYICSYTQNKKCAFNNLFSGTAACRVGRMTSSFALSLGGTTSSSSLPESQKGAESLGASSTPASTAGANLRGSAEAPICGGTPASALSFDTVVPAGRDGKQIFCSKSEDTPIPGAVTFDFAPGAPAYAFPVGGTVLDVQIFSPIISFLSESAFKPATAEPAPASCSLSSPSPAPAVVSSSVPPCDGVIATPKSSACAPTSGFLCASTAAAHARDEASRAFLAASNFPTYPHGATSTHPALPETVLRYIPHRLRTQSERESDNLIVRLKRIKRDARNAKKVASRRKKALKAAALASANSKVHAVIRTATTTPDSAVASAPSTAVATTTPATTSFVTVPPEKSWQSEFEKWLRKQTQTEQDSYDASIRERRRTEKNRCQKSLQESAARNEPR